MDVELLWFTCANKECDYIKTKGYARPFMRYIEGNKIYRHNGDLVILSCKLGDIILYSNEDNYGVSNSYFHTIHDKEICGVCLQRMKNERLLFP